VFLKNINGSNNFLEKSVFVYLKTSFIYFAVIINKNANKLNYTYFGDQLLPGNNN